MGDDPRFPDRETGSAGVLMLRNGREHEPRAPHRISMTAWGCTVWVHLALASAIVGLHGTATLPVAPPAIIVAMLVPTDDTRSAAGVGAPENAADPGDAGASSPPVASAAAAPTQASAAVPVETPPAASAPTPGSTHEPVQPLSTPASERTETDEFPGADGHAILPLPAEPVQSDPPPAARGKSAAPPRRQTIGRNAASPPAAAPQTRATRAPAPVSPEAEPSPLVAQEPGSPARGQQQAAAPIVPPRPLSAAAANPKPDYPAVARNRGIQGHVILRVDVSATGLPLEVTVTSTSGHAILDEAAIKAVRRWRFNPATQSGVAIDASAYVPILFRLDE
jgi:protein TonB